MKSPDFPLYQCWQAQVGKVEVGGSVVGGAAGPSHGVALTDTGKVWQWGGARWRFPLNFSSSALLQGSGQAGRLVGARAGGGA